MVARVGIRNPALFAFGSCYLATNEAVGKICIKVENFKTKDKENIMRQRALPVDRL
jgi:hypothetical protein